MARTLTKESLFDNPVFIDSVKKLYNTDLKSVCERYSALADNLKGEIRFFSSPGRAELVGNHTDHNHGLVIAGSIDLDVACAVVPTSDGIITIESEGYEPFTVNVNDLPVEKELFGSTKALVRGVCKGFTDRGFNVGGFTARASSNIFKGAGVSSSAAFELLICEILNVLYNDGKIGFVDKAIVSRFAENVYFGKPSGLMDQLTISRGDVSFMNFGTEIPFSESADWKFDDVSLVIINCGGDHCNLTDEYAAIRSEMESVASYFNKKVLGEVNSDTFFKSVPELKNRFSGRAVLRAIHFFEENERVKLAEKAISSGDKRSFLDIIVKSGVSSYELLQNCYPSGDVLQPIPLALAIVSRNKNTLAYRVHGGGFAGTILAFTDSRNASSYVSQLADIFGENNVFCVKVRKFGAVEVPFRR